MSRSAAKTRAADLWGRGCLLALLEAVADPDGGLWFWARAVVFAALCVATIIWLALELRGRRSRAAEPR